MERESGNVKHQRKWSPKFQSDNNKTSKVDHGSTVTFNEKAKWVVLELLFLLGYDSLTTTIRCYHTRKVCFIYLFIFYIQLIYLFVL